MNTRVKSSRMVLAASLVVALFAATSPAQGALIGFYPFENTVQDASVNNNNGAPTGILYAAGYEGQAAVFSGVGNTFVNLPIDASVGAMPKMTWGAWVKPSATGPPNREILSTDNGGFDRALTIDERSGGAATGTWRHAAFGGSPGVVQSTGPLPTIGQWRFVASVYDQTTNTVDLFVENATFTGLVQDTAATNIGGSQTFIRVGRHPGGAEPFDGLIDNVFVVNEALTPAQLESIRSGGKAAIQQLFGPQLVFQLRADKGVTQSGGSVSTWADQSGFGNHVSQSTPALQPTLVTGPIGKPAISFDNGQKLLGSALDAFDFSTLDFTVIAVLSVDNQSGSPNRALGNLLNGSPWSGMMLDVTTGENLGMGYRNFPGGAQSIILDPSTALGAGAFVFTGVRAGGVADIYRNWSLVASAAATQNIIGDAITIGAERTGGGEYFSGDISEIRIYWGTLSGPELEAIQRHLYYYWVTPEPTTLSLLGLGALGLLRRRRRRK